MQEGVALWEIGDLQGFGRLVCESGSSSIDCYEVGALYSLFFRVGVILGLDSLLIVRK